MVARLRSRGALAAALCLLVGAGLAGCKSADTGHSPIPPVSLNCPTTGSTALTLVVGARANTPAPQLPAQIQRLLENAATAGQQIQSVVVGGTAADGLHAQFGSTAQNPEMRQRDLQTFITSIEQSVSALKAGKPQADVLGALSEAARITPSGGTIILIDSGLSTTGSINFLKAGMFGADPKQVAAFLQKRDLLPSLTGKTLVLVNVGQSAAPQPQLPKDLQDQLVTLWSTIAKQASATCVATIQTDVSQSSISTAVPVSIVPLPAALVWNDCGTTVLGDGGSVGFIVNTATFRDPTAANSALKTLADQLIGHNQLVIVAGSTSSEGDASANQRLSVARADAVKQVLVGLNVSADRITTLGYGIHAPGRVQDMTADGTLIPWAAEQDRSVTVTLSCRSAG